MFFVLLLVPSSVFYSACFLVYKVGKYNVAIVAKLTALVRFYPVTVFL